MDQILKGAKGDFRKITITLPPATYELLLQESARRKIAGEPDHLLSEIAREGISRVLGDTTMLPLELTELQIYHYVDAAPTGDWHNWVSVNYLGNMVGEPSVTVLEELVLDLARRGWLALEKYAGPGGYVSILHWSSPAAELYSGNIRVRLTIAGRRRCQTLALRAEQKKRADQS